ncbi:MAG: pseudouridine synthase [Phycisphaeraceae bacterium]
MPHRPGIPDELTDANRGERLQKVMARAGIASRRDCEALITEGRVSVNGKPVTDLPAWVDPARDRIEIDGEPVLSPRGQKRREQKRHTYLMLHKPRRVIATTEDEQGRTNVLDLIDQHIDARLFPVGRLDADSTGLILLTDDGELANRLTHPRHGVPKTYLVTLQGRLTEEDRQKLQRGLYLAPRKPTLSEGGRPAKRAAMDQIKILRHDRDRTRGDRTTITVTLREGQNREIRRLLARLGHKVRHLKRTALGPLHLGDLPSAAWRPLAGDEIRQLRRAAGLK